MSEDLSRRMNEIVIEEDKSGFVIDAVVKNGEETDTSVKKEEEKKKNKKNEKEEENSETAVKKAGRKLLKVNEKNVDKGDSGEDDSEHGVSFHEEEEKLVKRDKGEQSSSSNQAAPSSESLLTKEADDRRLTSFLNLIQPKRLSLVSDMTDLKAKLAEAGSNLVVIDFFATWCGPCKNISPKIEELAKEYPDVVFLKVDIDECDEIATEYDVQSMPTFIFIKNTLKIDGFSGANFEKLKDCVQKLK